MQIKLINSNGQFFYQPLGSSVLAYFFASFYAARRHDYKSMYIFIIIDLIFIFDTKVLMHSMPLISMVLAIIKFVFFIYIAQNYNQIYLQKALDNGFYPVDNFACKILTQYDIIAKPGNTEIPNFSNLSQEPMPVPYLIYAGIVVLYVGFNILLGHI